MRFGVIASLMLVCAGAGCTSTNATFVVDIINKTRAPLSAGLIKTGGGITEGWTSPEQIAINAPQLMERKWGTLVPPQQTGLLGPQTGPFESGTAAVLRIYTGDAPVSELIAFGRNDPGRVDVYLWPGRSAYVVEMVNGRLAARPADDERLAPAKPAAAAQPQGK